MKRATIRAQLEIGHCSRLDQSRLPELTRVFLSGINPGIQRAHGIVAEAAVRKVLVMLFTAPRYTHLCVEALLQLCRDEPFPFVFTPRNDAALILRINMDRYFPLLRAADLCLETQEGVV